LLRLWRLAQPIFSDINPLKDSIIFENDLMAPIDVAWYVEE
jgi:hypothetical protein